MSVLGTITIRVLDPAIADAAVDQTTQTVTVTVYGDLNIDPNQVFYLTLMNATNAGLGRSRGTGTILNDYQ